MLSYQFNYLSTTTLHIIMNNLVVVLFPWILSLNVLLLRYLMLSLQFNYTPGNSHPNGTVKPNANINSKQTILKATDNYVIPTYWGLYHYLYILLHFYTND